MAERCNGEMIHPPQYSKESRALFEKWLPECRAHLAQLIEKQMSFTCYAGDRFKSDNIVWMTLRSGVPEDMFTRNPERWVTDALLCCAERDHWYMKEKKWENPELPDVQPEEDDD